MSSHTRRTALSIFVVDDYPDDALTPERDAAAAAGCDGVISKPFDLTALADALPRLLTEGAKALDVPGLSLTKARRGIRACSA
jgi:CheY-like chemotaxis protein